MNSLTIPRGQENQLSSSLSGSSIGEENNIGEDNCRDFNRPSSTSSYDDDLDSIRNKDKFAQSSSTLRNSRLNGKTQLDSDRDQYGFKKSYQWVTRKEHADFESTYTHIQQRRKIKWDSLLAENGGNLPTKSSKVKRYIRKGIPPFLRGCVWFHYSGAANKMKDQPDLYEKLLQKSEDPRIVNEYVEVIERDLHRTFPENIKFKSTVVSEDGGSTLMTDNVPIIQSLRRVLVAFSLYSPNIGYCQSLNYIAGLLLLFMEEEQAFWTIVAIIHEYLPENMYDLSAGFGWDVDKLDLNMPTITLVTSHWFLTLYINILPTETMLRVWDCFFYEGHKVLFRVALAIFKINEDKILAVTDDPMEVFQIVQNMPKRLIDCHKLMEVCFRRRKAVSHIQRKEIERLREHFRERRKQRVGTILTNKY
ncbi:hypothetical protein G9A89_004145 [Geosiphon pyriformis]|nr:hypothetical protein G9A89_004145 [Geosiphon pyriformis]